jgi:hypothetical protein
MHVKHTVPDGAAYLTLCYFLTAADNYIVVRRLYIFTKIPQSVYAHFAAPSLYSLRSGVTHLFQNLACMENSRGTQNVTSAVLSNAGISLTSVISAGQRGAPLRSSAVPFKPFYGSGKNS